MLRSWELAELWHEAVNSAAFQARGVACLNSLPPPPPPPPSGPPKVFEPVFLQIEMLGKMGGAAGAENFFAGMRHAVEFLNIPMCVYSKRSVHLGISLGSIPGGLGGRAQS